MSWLRPDLRRAVPIVPLLLVSISALASAAGADVVRTFAFSPADVHLIASPDGATVTLDGGVAGGRPGEPELPVVPAFVDVDAGTRVTHVSIEALGWASLGVVAGRVRTVAADIPGLPRVASAADPALFGSTDWFPVEPGTAGPVGELRGRALASFALRPVRVRPATGELEIATRIVVRVTTAPVPEADRLVRRRIVPEWESSFALKARRYGRGLESPVGWTAPPAARTDHAGGFAPTSLPSVEGSPVQYLIITNNAMAPQLQRLADWHTRAGMPTVVRTIEFINQNELYGVDQQDRIRRFIRDAYEQWGITDVLLAGDTDILPPRYAFTTFFGGNSIPTELYYSSLEGNWNADGDSLFGEGFGDSTNQGDAVDLLPDVFVGRAPVTTPAAAQTFVNKTLQYSETPLGDYEDRAMYAAEVLFPQNWSPGQGISIDGATHAESAIRKLTPTMNPRRMYENYTAFDTVGAVPLTRAALLDSLNRGWGIFHHVGHGYRNSMSVGDAAITNPDAAALTNGNRTWVLYSIDCTSNAIDFDCLGEAFMNNPHGGCVANVGSTREDFPLTGRNYQDEFYDLVFQDTVATLGEAFAMSKAPFAAIAQYDGMQRWTQFSLALLGDPAMPIWWRRPTSLAVTFPAAVPLSDSAVTVHVADGANPLAGARVCLFKAGEVYEVATTDALGDAALSLRAQTTGSVSVTVTDGGAFRPYESTLALTPAAGEVLAARDSARALDDGGAAGTHGDGNGVADAGETLDWTIPLTNTGGTDAANVGATLSTADPRVTLLTATASYGAVAGGATVVGTPFRIALDPGIPDGTEILLGLDMVSDAGHRSASLRLPVHAAELFLAENAVVDDGTNGTSGNGNHRFDVGESVDLSFGFTNTRSGLAHGLRATLSTTSDGIAIAESTATLGDIAANQSAFTAPFRVVSTTGADPRFVLTVRDSFAVRFERVVDLVPPGAVSGLIATGSTSSIALVWAKATDADVMGYNVYRASSPAGPFTGVNASPVDRTAYFEDEGLPGLTRFDYEVSAVDSSGNESGLSAVAFASTSPPLHPGWPQPTGRSVRSAPLIGNIDRSPDSSYEIFVGSGVPYCWHADGTPLRDADGSALTAGDFSTEGTYYAAGGTLADLNNDGTWEIIAPTWDSKQLFVFEPNGSDYPGFPKQLYDNIWSSAAVGNIDNTPQPEIVFGSNGSRIYAFHADGTEVLDGDNNPATTGVFKVLGSAFNYGSPALADLDGDGKLDIVYGSSDGNLYAWRGDGTNLPGWPQPLFAGTSSSPAVGDIDNDGIPEIAITANNGKLYVFKANGTFQPGFPVTGVQADGTGTYPSPALADMEGTGQKDIVINTTDGYVKVFRPNGTLLPQWSNVRYSYTALASECSPVVADIDGDGQNEVLVGGEDANLYAFDNDGSPMGGFPIHLGGEVRGTPAVWDLDHDGLTEIVVSCWDENVYVWDYPGVFSPAGPPPWAMWRHDQYRRGTLGTPIVVSVATVAFSAHDAAHAGLELAFAMPAAPEAVGRYDIYRASGPGAVGSTAAALPAGFERLDAEPLSVTGGSIVRWTDASAMPGRGYRYLFVRRQDRPGDAFLAYGPFAATASAEAPELAFVDQNFPNPVPAHQTTITYGVPRGAGGPVRTTLRFYDVRGRLVRTLVDGLVPPGRYAVQWDGRDDRGARVSPGVFFYEYTAGPTRLTKRALLLAP